MSVGPLYRCLGQNVVCHSRNITNRMMLSRSESLDAIVATFYACQESYASRVPLSERAAEGVSTLMHVLVTLVTVDSNVARHLVEKDNFMPLLFTLLQAGVRLGWQKIGPCATLLMHAGEPVSGRWPTCA
jgi:hypothetical protein